MYKLCIFLAYENNADAFCKTVEGLTNAVDFEHARLVIIFDRFMYELDTSVYRTLDTMQDENVKCLYNISPSDLALQIITEIQDAEYFFIIKEGDLIDPDYLVYINYFFMDNGGQCDVLFTPVVEPGKNELPEGFINLPYNGIKQLEEENSMILPLFMTGAVFAGDIFKSIPLDTYDSIDIFYEIMIKAIIKNKCYGIINTVSYISEKKVTSHMNACLLKKLADCKEDFDADIYCNLIDYISVYVREQLSDSIENCDKSLFALKAYAPLEFSEVENNAFSLCLTDVRNCFAKVEIIGKYICPCWKTDTRLRVSSLNYERVIYEEQFGSTNQWKQEIFFKIIIPLEDNTVSLQIELSKAKGFEPVEKICFASKEEKEERSAKINNYTVSFENSKLHIKKIAQRAYYKVSCIIPVYNGGEYLEESISSVISQSVDFFAQIQILLINNGSTDNTESICLKYENKYPYNISYFYMDEPNVSKARNLGLQYAMGKYISFLDADDKLPPDYMETGIRYLEENEERIDMVAFPIEYFGKSGHLPKPRLNYRFTEKAVVDVLDKPGYIQFSACSILTKKSAVDKLAFNEKLSYSEDAEFVHQIILNKMQYGVVEKPAYLYRIRDDGLSATQSKKTQLSWYMKNTVLSKALVDYSLAKYACITKYTQNLIIHDLSDNLVTDIPEDVSEQIDIPSIMNAISESLQYVEDDVIKNVDTLDYWFKCFLLKLKHGSVVMKGQGSVLEFYFEETRVELLGSKIHITEIKEKNNRLCVSGFYNLASYDGIELIALQGRQAYSAVITENRHKNIYFLGEAVHKAKIFDFEIPFEDEGVIDFCLRMKGDVDYPFDLEFPYKTKENAFSFFVNEHILVLSTQQKNQIKLEHRTHSRLSEMINNSLKPFSKPEFNADKSILKEYLSMYPIMSASRIWLFMDEPKSANGNAEVMFSFCSNIKDGIEKVYVIDKNTVDGIRLEGIGTVIQYGSDMHKLMYLYAEKIIVSNVLDNSYDPFAGSVLYSVYNGIVKADVVYLPNEPQIEDMSAKLNRFTRNISLYAVASDTEREFVLNNAYGYGGDIVQAIGLPKYDRLVDKEQKRIIFMPSWREKLYLGDNKFNIEFSNSEYCKKISELLCDERLFEAMMEYDYEMYFMPHEKTYLHLADFDMYENVNVISPDFPRYELFTSGALLITDYMPAFDFVYMKKPVIYYRFAEDEAGTIPLCEDEFGETVSDHEVLVDRIIGHIQNSCIMQEGYVKRVDRYFNYIDNKNCERIYTMIKGFR